MGLEIDPKLSAALDAAIMLARSRAGGRVPVVGVAGPQGSGKTTLVQAFAAQDPLIAALSLDDVYLRRAEREELSRTVHPLLATRGVPGTHDLDLLFQVIETLTGPMRGWSTMFPAFDKVKDDRAPAGVGRLFPGDASMVLIDGWCLGARAEPDEALDDPVNMLESSDDRLGRWRSWVNSQLALRYQEVWSRFDAVLYLRAPSFKVIEGWRLQQEEGLLGRPLTDIDRRRIRRFVAHFERITRHMLAGGHCADIIVQLDDQRGVTGVERRTI